MGEIGKQGGFDARQEAVMGLRILYMVEIDEKNAANAFNK